jgi:hypothetical protein
MCGQGGKRTCGPDTEPSVLWDEGMPGLYKDGDCIDMTFGEPCQRKIP